MNMKKFFRGPVIWIIGALLFVVIGTQAIASASAPKHVDTWEVIAAINSGRASKAVLQDREQLVVLTLLDDSRIEADYQIDQGDEIIAALEAANVAGKLSKGYNIEVTRENILVTLLVNLLPVLLMVFLLFFFMSQMNGGSRAMSFGKSRAKPLSKEIGRAHV